MHATTRHPPQRVASHTPVLGLSGPTLGHAWLATGALLEGHNGACTYRGGKRSASCGDRHRLGLAGRLFQSAGADGARGSTGSRRDQVAASSRHARDAGTQAERGRVPSWRGFLQPPVGASSMSALPPSQPCLWYRAVAGLGRTRQWSGVLGARLKPRAESLRRGGAHASPSCPTRQCGRSGPGAKLMKERVGDGIGIAFVTR